MWIWSISIPSERARSAASFIIPFLDCISHTEEISSYEGIYHGMSSSPPISSSIPKSGHEPFYSTDNRDIWYEFAGVNFNVHAHGNSGWGLVERALPFWSFGGNIYPDQPENQEPLVAPGVPSFPTPLDGQAWYLYGKSLQGPNNFLPAVEI